MVEGLHRGIFRMSKARGSANMIVDLTDGRITVIHGTDNVVLAEWQAKVCDWDYIWQIIGILKAGNDVEIREL